MLTYVKRAARTAGACNSESNGFKRDKVYRSFPSSFNFSRQLAKAVCSGSDAAGPRHLARVAAHDDEAGVKMRRRERDRSILNAAGEAAMAGGARDDSDGARNRARAKPVMQEADVARKRRDLLSVAWNILRRLSLRVGRILGGVAAVVLSLSLSGEGSKRQADGGGGRNGGAREPARIAA